MCRKKRFACTLTVPAVPTTCNITLLYDQSSGRLQIINSTWDSMPVSHILFKYVTLATVVVLLPVINCEEQPQIFLPANIQPKNNYTAGTTACFVPLLHYCYSIVDCTHITYYYIVNMLYQPKSLRGRHV